ncbi:hypothetical protein PG997_007476 [Apiospora hydei]|uniref:Uncharacterized protein n=1 Tax=Apiospora hydei TaxID=1337664 RepID=A0ABR1W848_9PEZI
MAGSIAAQDQGSIEARLQDEVKKLDDAEFHYRAHFKSVIDTYNDASKPVLPYLLEQAQNATQSIDELKKNVAGLRYDLYKASLGALDTAVKEHGRVAIDEPTRNAVLLEILRELDPLFQDGTLAFGRNIIHGYAAQEYFDCPAEPSENLEEEMHDFLDKKMPLLTDNVIPSTLRPQQTDVFGHQGMHFEYKMIYVAMGARSLRAASTNICRSVISIYKGTDSQAAMANLMEPFLTTYTAQQLNLIYQLLNTESAVESVNDIIDLLTSPSVVTANIMLYKLMHSAIVLAKYSCLVTFLTAAAAVSFPRPEEIHPVVKDAIRKSTVADTLKCPKQLLNCFSEMKEQIARGDFSARADDSALQYICGDMSGLALMDGFFASRLKDFASQLPDLDLDLVSFFSSCGYE